MNASNRLIVNTLAQYTRTIINMVLGLYSTRLVMQILGVDDYGLYSLIAGVVTMFAFFTAALAAATQRYLSYYQGKEDISQLKKLFNNCLLVHILAASVICVILLCISPFLFNGFLNISEERIHAATILYIIVILNLFISINLAPYKALVVAHENIVYTSIIEVLDSVLKFVFVLLLNFINFDRLIIYGLFILLIQILNFCAIAFYDYKKYNECSIPTWKVVDRAFLKEFSSFTGWTIYNAGCNIGRTQGVAIILNKFFGTAINAAYGISATVVSYVSVVSQSLKNAIAPQIMKSEGAGGRNKMLRLCSIESKMSYFLLSMVGIPVMFEIDPILHVWLGTAPLHANTLCCMSLIATLIDMTTTGLSSANFAIGKLRDYSLYVYTIKLLTIPTVIICLLYKKSVLSVLIAYTLIEALSSIVRLPFMKKNAGIDITRYIKDVYLKISIPTLFIILTCYCIVNLFDFQFRFLITISLSIILYIPVIYFLGLGKDEKKTIINVVKKIYNR